MKIKFYVTLLMLAFSITSIAQIVTLRGKVTNAKTGETLPGASIISGSFGTSADGNGNFVFYVQQSVVEESGITVSSIGYQTTHLTDITDNYNVTMTPTIHELQAVNILSGAEAIVQKAYRQVRSNYLNKNYNIIGIQKMVHSIRDTFGYQYYCVNNTKVKLYMSAYADTPRIAQAGLMEKDQHVWSNPNALKIAFINSYSIGARHDYVHSGAGLLRGNPELFKYSLNRKELINGRKVYVVNFFSKLKEGDAGILYIDTATYAFVRVLLTIYNVKSQSQKNIDLNKVSIFMQYKQYDGKWALDAAKYNSAAMHKGYEADRMDEFQVARLITENAAPLPPETFIKDHTDDDSVKPYDGFSDADKNIPKNIQKQAESTFSKNVIPKIADKVH